MNSTGTPRWLSGKESACQCRRLRRHRFDPWVGEDLLQQGMATHSRILAWKSHEQCVCVFNHSLVLDSLWPYGLWPTRLLCLWDSPGKNTGVGLPFPSTGHLPDPGMEPASPESPALQADSKPLSHQGSPPVNHTQRQKDITPKYSPPPICPGQKVSNMLLGKSREIVPERMDQSRNDVQLWMRLMVKVESDVIKKNIA